jgi:hypothetical protein
LDYGVNLAHERRLGRGISLRSRVRLESRIIWVKEFDPALKGLSYWFELVKSDPK